MVAVLERIVGSVVSFGRASLNLSQTVVTTTKGEVAPNEVFRVGDYYADYSTLSTEDVAASDPEADALLRRSRIVSVKRGL